MTFRAIALAAGSGARRAARVAALHGLRPRSARGRIAADRQAGAGVDARHARRGNALQRRARGAALRRQLLGQLVHPGLRRRAPGARIGARAPRRRACSIVGVLYQDAPVDAEAFLARYGDAGYPHVIDDGGRLAIEYGVTGPPETFFVDADGIVRDKQFGPLTDDLMADRLGSDPHCGEPMRRWLVPVAGAAVLAVASLGALLSAPVHRAHDGRTGRCARARAALPGLPGTVRRRLTDAVGRRDPPADRRAARVGGVVGRGARALRRALRRLDPAGAGVARAVGRAVRRARAGRGRPRRVAGPRARASSRGGVASRRRGPTAPARRGGGARCLSQLLLLIGLAAAGVLVLGPFWRRGEASLPVDDDHEAALLRHRVALEALRDVEADRRSGSLDDAAYAEQLAEAEARAAGTRGRAGRCGLHDPASAGARALPSDRRRARRVHRRRAARGLAAACDRHRQWHRPQRAARRCPRCGGRTPGPDRRPAGSARGRP